MKSKFIYIILFSTMLNFVYAQEKSIVFADELCTYEGVYDSGKYTENELKDTYELIKGVFFSYNSDKEEMEDSYAEIKNKLATLSIVKEPFFQSLLDSTLLYLDRTYEAKLIQLEAEDNPRALLRLYQDDAEIRQYAEALVDRETKLLESYAYLTKKQMETNGDPERLWDNYQFNIAQANKYDLAFDYVLVYGWWNAVNHQLPHISYDGRQSQAFEKLFVRLETLDCDEP
ncbi:hypothetical protein [Sphingobacterium pedocola]|nr:hypothetical protein [Sphingobacterium pedocola]